MLGYTSNFISHRKAEMLAAQWVLNDLIKSKTLYGNCSKPEWNWLEESATRFASIGATVLKMDCGNIGERVPWGEVGHSSFTGPFFISVGYMAATSDAAKYESGNCLVLNFFGYSKILNKDSTLWRMIPYLWPY